ncbi:MAG: TonB-dependent receptor [Bacteroidia bacterium]|nr:TonB-dependent receptor [Bacteroidia bacterium]
MPRFLTAIFFIIFSCSCFAQKFTISGTAEDLKSGEKLINANVYDAISLKGTITNNYGFYSLTLPNGNVKITLSYVGYQAFQKEFNLSKDTVIKVKLNPSLELGEVVVEDTKTEKQVESTQMSRIELPIKKVKELPVFLGEVDIMKTIQLMPGVQSGSEGTSGLYVRGGGPDQNLVLLDGVPVYNVDHLFGFFSVFNADAIQTVSLIKGGFPARYGGRLSSVLDIYMKEGNNKEYHGEGSISWIATKLTFEGPIIKEKTSFIISGRRTYLDALVVPLIKLYTDGERWGGYFFYDVNAKINHKINDKHRIFLSSYFGRDKVYSTIQNEYYQDGNKILDENQFDLHWGNITTALRWNYIINNKLFSNTTCTYSRYNFTIADKIKNNETSGTLKYTSGIDDWAGNIDFDYMPTPDHSIKFGANTTYHTFSPGIFVIKSTGQGNNIDTAVGNSNIFANEFFTYFEDDIRLGARWKVNAGLHYSGFYVRKKFYQSLQPRLSGRFLVNEKISVKAAFSQMTQYILLLTNSNIGLPTDLWLPVTDRIKPQQSYQVAAGGAYAINKQFDFSIEGFYKTMENLIEYKEGAEFFTLSNDWQDKVVSGKGWSYGVEFLLQKNLGKLSGWIGYTLAWSERQFNNLNFGNKYPYKYDRRHDISIAVTYKFKEEMDAGLTWVFGTGNAVSLPIEKYLPNIIGNIFNNSPVTYYDGRNGYRMPAYHRLDLGVNFHKKKKHWDRTWSFGVYNAYNRQNPFMIYFSHDNDGNTVLKQLSLFPVIPFIRYSIKF